MAHVPHCVRYCIAAKVEFGCYLRTMKAPEALIPLLRRYGWEVIATETELYVNTDEHQPDEPGDDVA